MQPHNVNRKLETTETSFWDGYAHAAPRIHEHEQPGPWPTMDQLDLFCSGCAGHTWSHDCWTEISA